MGDERAVNAACGRYLAFFLRRLLDRAPQGEVVDPSQDEAMMAYVSGDMQGTADGSWIWQGSETGANLANVPGQAGPAPTQTDSQWEGWEWVEKSVAHLLGEKQRRDYERREYERRDIVMESRPEASALLAPPSAGSDTTERRSSSAHSRMTIASII